MITEKQIRLLLIIILSGLPQISISKSSTVKVAGYVSHGVNIYNGQRIGDYSNVSPKVPWLNPTPLIDEIRAYNPLADTAEVITDTTDTNRLVATSDTFFRFMNPSGFISPTVVNVPIGNIGSNYFGYTSAEDRIVPEHFPELNSEPTVYRAKDINSSPTIKQWNEISGLMTIKKSKHNSYQVQITIRDAFPKSIYTFWDVGALFPLSDNEQGYAVPLGGLPNTLVTDAKGCGTAMIEVPYSLTRKCESGAGSCSSYINAVYHWDTQTYGASPGQTMLGMPAGVLAANQLTFPTSGDILINVQNKPPEAHGCH